MKKIYHPELSWEDGMRIHGPTCTVLEPEPVAKFTGLLDANGHRLMAMLKSEPVGFVHFKPK